MHFICTGYMLATYVHNSTRPNGFYAPHNARLCRIPPKNIDSTLVSRIEWLAQWIVTSSILSTQNFETLAEFRLSFSSCNFVQPMSVCVTSTISPHRITCIFRLVLIVALIYCEWVWWVALVPLADNCGVRRFYICPPANVCRRATRQQIAGRKEKQMKRTQANFKRFNFKRAPFYPPFFVRDKQIELQNIYRVSFSVCIYLLGTFSTRLARTQCIALCCLVFLPFSCIIISNIICLRSPRGVRERCTTMTYCLSSARARLSPNALRDNIGCIFKNVRAFASFLF